MVSVIIPTYNREKTIASSIQSVLEQTYSNLELIVVDDGSVDDTEKIVNEIKDERLKYIKCKTNGGVAAARNVGIAASRGEFIAFNDSDDIWKKTKLAVQMKLMENNMECDFVYCAFARRFINGVKVRVPAKENDLDKLHGKVFEKLLQGNFISTQTILFRKRIIDNIGMFNEKIKAFDDYEFVLRVAREYPIFYIDEELVEVEESDNSVMLKSNYINHFKDYVTILNQYWDDYEEKKNLYNMLRTILVYIGYMTFEERETYGELLMPFWADKNFLLHEISAMQRQLRRAYFKEHMVEEILNLEDEIEKEYFQKNHIHSVAIYGNGYVGKLLRKNILNLGICDCFMIDKSPQKDKYLVYTLNEIVPKADIVVISVFDEMGLIKKNVSQIIKYPVVHIEQWMQKIKNTV